MSTPQTDEQLLTESPSETRAPRVKEQQSSSAGWPAVWTAMLHVFRSKAPYRGIKGLLGMNQKRGYDCPGCAWPDPDGNRHLAEFCENGAKAVAEETTSRRATPEIFGAWSIAQLSQLSDYRLGQIGRFTEPMILRENSRQYERLSWDDAFREIAQELNRAAPQETVFYTSGKARATKRRFFFQLFARVHGTNNLPDCSNMCHESSGYALNRTIGSGKGSVKLDDFDHADLIIIIGQNPGTNHPRMLTELQKAVRNGCKIISINPMKEAGFHGLYEPARSEGACLACPRPEFASPARSHQRRRRRPQGDSKASPRIRKETPGSGIDREFIDRHCDGFAALEKDLEQTSWDQDPGRKRALA